MMGKFEIFPTSGKFNLAADVGRIGVPYHLYAAVTVPRPPGRPVLAQVQFGPSFWIAPAVNRRTALAGLHGCL